MNGKENIASQSGVSAYAVTGFIFAILSTIVWIGGILIERYSLLIFITRIIFFLLSLIFNTLGLRDTKKYKKSGKFFAITGLVIAIGIPVILFVFFLYIFYTLH